MPLPPSPTNPPPPSINGDAILLARISVLEARLAALEQVIKIGPAGVEISSLTGLKISIGKDCVVAVQGNLAISSKKRIEISAAQSSVLGSERTVMQCASSVIDISDSGQMRMHATTVELTGTKVSVTGSGDVVIKGAKILQN